METQSSLPRALGAALLLATLPLLGPWGRSLFIGLVWTPTAVASIAFRPICTGWSTD